MDQGLIEILTKKGRVCSKQSQQKNPWKGEKLPPKVYGAIDRRTNATCICVGKPDTKLYKYWQTISNPTEQGGQGVPREEQPCWRIKKMHGIEKRQSEEGPSLKFPTFCPLPGKRRSMKRLERN